MPHTTVTDAPAPTAPTRRRRDWPGLFLRAVLSLFLGLPLGGVLFALTGLGIAVANGDPILQHPWLLTFRTLAAAVSYVFLGGFAWTPEGGYESMHAWYAAGVVLAFVLMSRPWRRWTRRRQPEPWPRRA
ncbi:hypothetical protein [Methylobacterium aquaticum]|uniref:hypothetical protein n=1 Tax=Methylobacterium aquaticum TaxID=270351 RepID=UPI0019312BD9|nr:hypothetical protein [Methylobacterium aquaticum]QRE76322.1 hypothetical protein F1D61_24620 [Methylobacterium aquaticum]